MSLPQENPAEYISIFEAGCKDALKLSLTSQGSVDAESNDANIPDFQVILKSSQNPLSLRQLTAEHVNKLIKVMKGHVHNFLTVYVHLSIFSKVPGIVIKTSEVQSKATIVAVTCSKCRSNKLIPARDPLSSVAIPNKCDGQGDCPMQSFEVNVDLCEYIDQQRLKLQESPEVVPTGEMPRNILAIVER